MEYRLQLSLIFGIGVIAQSLFLIRNRFNKETAQKLIVCAILSAIFGLALSHRYEIFYIYEHIFKFFVVFSFFFSIFFFEEVLPLVNKYVLLSYNIILM
jgi:hypothetical protein